jgi:hypothetical protein
VSPLARAALTQGAGDDVAIADSEAVLPDALTADPLSGFLGWNLLALGSRLRESNRDRLLLLFTVLPLPPLLSVPAFRRFMAPSTSLDADLE